MCGIFGMFTGARSNLNNKVVYSTLKDLFLFSESRGKEASGMAVLTRDEIQIAKTPEPASKFIKSEQWKTLSSVYDDDDYHKSDYKLSIGHSRLVTNGAQQVHENNQPVITSGLVAIHNGIITNVDALWSQKSKLNREYEIDTEVIVKLIDEEIAKDKEIIRAIQSSYSQIEGVANLALLSNEYDQVILATNNGSLYTATNLEQGILIFASERYILKNIIKKNKLLINKKQFVLNHVEPMSGCIIDLNKSKFDWFSFAESDQSIRFTSVEKQKRKITDITKFRNTTDNLKTVRQGPYILPNNFKDEYEVNRDVINKLRRCTRCVLPETFPFIEFDGQGVCNYCKTYQKVNLLGEQQLIKDLERYRKNNGEADCLVTLSGGRDSCYALHIIKKELGLNPITYTYDWGMVTDLARRNQMRMCGKLGVEHILVSADISLKRNNIRKNVNAWLKKPNLGTIPLFMAGDKQYFYYANKIGKETNSEIVIMGENPLETTRFKVGFCGISPEKDPTQSHNLSRIAKMKLAGYYATSYLKNPSYINSSLIDTISAFCSYYVIPKNYLDIFKYLKWEEDKVSTTLINEYNWEISNDTKSTWRIGDGTAPFYNYIYYTMAGFTENDTFRSNQVREGVLNRKKALELVERDNIPRYESMQWYCDVIGINFSETIKIINTTSKLYQN